jgi:hypothetical protein
VSTSPLACLPGEEDWMRRQVLDATINADLLEFIET